MDTICYILTNYTLNKLCLLTKKKRKWLKESRERIGPDAIIKRTSLSLLAEVHCPELILSEDRISAIPGNSVFLFYKI